MSRHRALLVVLSGLLLRALPAQALDWNALTGMVNLRCVSHAIVGPCFCGPYNPCVLVSYWEPAWLVETVKIPGTTSLDSVAPLLQSILQGLGVPPFGGGGAGNATGGGHTNLQYNEAHVVTFPDLFGGGPCSGCGGGSNSFTVHYASEIDPLWRTAAGAPGLLDLVGLGQLGVWGPLYPRGGKAIHSSEPVGSGIAAARALNVAANPTGVATNPEYRVVLEEVERNSRCCQMGQPKVTDCMMVGTNPISWEQRAVSQQGTYIWLFWRQRTCCVLPEDAYCGIAMVGGHGGNRCLPHQ